MTPAIERVPPLARLADDDAVEPAVGVDPRALLVDEQLGGAAVGEPLFEHLRRRRRAQPQHDLGPEPLGACRGGAGARRPWPTVVPVVGAAARPGVGQHRPAERGGEAVDAVGGRRSPSPATITPGRRR